MNRSRRPRAIAIAAPFAQARPMRDLAADWRRWSKAERIAARIAAALAAATSVAWVVLG